MEKEKVLTFTEWCINLSNDILSSKNKEDLKIKEELKNLVHDEPGENVPRGTNNQAVNLSSESKELFWRDIAKKINTGIVLIPIKPKDFKGSYGDYIKEFEKKASNLHKYLDVNKDGALAGDKVVDGTIGDKDKVGRVGSDGPSGKLPTYVCIRTYKNFYTIEKGEKSFILNERPGSIFFNKVGGGRASFSLNYLKTYLKDYFAPESEVKEFKEGLNGRLGVGHVENLTSSGGPEKETTYENSLLHKVLNFGKDNYYENFSRCSDENGELPPAKEDNIEKDTIVEGFELEMMFDALNSVVFNKKDQISDKNIKKIIKTLFKKFNITVKD